MWQWHHVTSISCHHHLEIKSQTRDNFGSERKKIWNYSVSFICSIKILFELLFWKNHDFWPFFFEAAGNSDLLGCKLALISSAFPSQSSWTSGSIALHYWWWLRVILLTDNWTEELQIYNPRAWKVCMRTVWSLWCRTRDARLSFEAGTLSYARKKKCGGCATFFPSIHLKSSGILSEDNFCQLSEGCDA